MEKEPMQCKNYTIFVAELEVHPSITTQYHSHHFNYSQGNLGEVSIFAPDV